MTDRRVHLGLSRSQRLRKRSAFLQAQACGCRRSTRSLVVYALPRAPSPEERGGRLGITVSKQVGKAVVRNRVKRWLREGYRRSEDRPTATDVVVIAKPSAAARGYHALAAELRQLLRSISKP